jgi:hypothetical protein
MGVFDTGYGYQGPEALYEAVPVFCAGRVFQPEIYVVYKLVREFHGPN